MVVRGGRVLWLCVVVVCCGCVFVVVLVASVFVVVCFGCVL